MEIIFVIKPRGDIQAPVNPASDDNKLLIRTIENSIAIIKRALWIVSCRMTYFQAFEKGDKLMLHMRPKLTGPKNTKCG